MTMRAVLGCVAVLLMVSAGCDDDEEKKAGAAASASGTAQAAGAAAVALPQRCEQLGKSCGELDKHKADITKECKDAAKTQSEKGCATQVAAAYDCFEKEICTEKKKIWALDDFRVLSERNKKCVEQRQAVEKCVGGGAE